MEISVGVGGGGGWGILIHIFLFIFRDFVTLWYVTTLSMYIISVPKLYICGPVLGSYRL